jgi:hypothetical protein
MSEKLQTTETNQNFIHEEVKGMCNFKRFSYQEYLWFRCFRVEECCKLRNGLCFNLFIIIAGIKVILDFVPNHSSDEHEWFLRSLQREGQYTDYYTWHDGRVNASGDRIPPNNWVSPVRMQHGHCSTEYLPLKVIRKNISPSYNKAILLT